MAITQFQGVDQGGNPVTITITDDPAEGGGNTLSDIVAALNGTLTVDDSGGFSVSIDGESVGLATESSLSSINTVLGNQGDVSETNTGNAASVVAFLKGVIDTLGATLTVTDDGGLTISSLPSLPAGGNNIGSVGVDSLPSNLITNGALDVNATFGSAAVEIQGTDSTGTTQTLGFVDGEDIAKVADTSSITAAENGIQIFGEDSGGNPVLISTNDAGEVHIREVPSQSGRALSLGASTTTIASADAELTGIWVGSSTEFVYLKIYEGTGNTVGNDAPALTLPVPAESGGTMDISPRSFTGGIEVAATLSEGDGATDAPTGVVTANVFYR